MKDKLIREEMIQGLHPAFRGRFGKLLTKFVFKLGGLNKVNAIYDGSKHLDGVDFTNDLLDKLEIKRIVKNIEVLDALEGKPFITVSNHPYGHIDGIIEVSLIGAARNDFKIMVNWVLMHIDTMEDFFIGVNPFPKGNKISQVKSSAGGVKLSLEHLKSGHPLGLFPAGGISLPNVRGKVIDCEWQESILKFIKKAKVPVVPVYITGSNSLLYQLLGYIGWKVRTVRLLHEVTNKRGKTITLHFGKPISVEKQNEYRDIKEFGKFLHSKTYEMMD